MARALVDTTVLYAAADASDEWHDRGISILKGIDDGELPEGIVLGFVLAETINGLTARVSNTAATDFLDRVDANEQFHVERLSAAAFATGKAYFRSDNRLSLVDAFVVAHARGQGIEFVYSFDDDFDGRDGVTRLSTSDNPFT